MARLPRKFRIGIAAVVSVTLLLVAGYAVRTRILAGASARADSTAAVDTSAAGETHADEKSKKGRGKRGKKKEEAQPVPVEVAAVGRRDISAFYVTTATLVPERKVDVLAKIADQVVSIVVEEGQRVREGDLLCQLDDRELKVALDDARIRREQLQREMERLEQMHLQNLVSEKEFADAKFQYDLARNTYESASVRYGHARVKAPFDGVITERLVEAGQNVAMGGRLFVLADDDPLELTMYVPEKELRSISRGQKVLIQPDVNPDLEIEGSIVRIAPEVDQRTGTVRVTAVTRGGGFPGSFVRVRVVTDTRRGILSVLRRSVVADAGDRFVFVAEADTVRRVSVDIGYEDEQFAEVTTGISEGDSVVTAGVGAIRQGTRIRTLVSDEKNVAEAVRK